MRQALHIFKKDARHLWFEITMVLIVTVGFAFTGAHRARWLVDPGANRTAAWTLVLILLPLAWWTLIARVIHAEALPGDRQFWISRPYSWKSLLLAKVLFIVVFINVPMLFADALIVRAYGLHPLSTQLPGLLWTQVLLTIVFLLPIAALSAITAGFVQLIFAVLTQCVVALVFAIVAPETVLGGFLGPFDWVQTYYVFLVIALGGLTVLVWQYSRRRTAAARALTVAMVTLGIVGMLSIPWPAAFAIQSLMSPQRVNSSTVRVMFDSGDSARAMTQRDGRVRIIIPLDISGLPARTTAKVEGFSVALEAPDGTVWKSNQILPASAMLEGQEFALGTTVSGSFYLKAKDKPLKLRGSLYLTLFGDPQSSNVPFGDHPVTVPHVGACSASRTLNGPPYFLVCSSGFRFPLAEVSYRFLQSFQGGFQTVWSSTQPRPISYLPFPAGVGLDPISQDVRFSNVDTPASEARVSTVEPIAYLRRNFDAGEVKLNAE
jgi:hypothetical protein